MAIIVRLLLFVAIILIAYWLIRYFFNPKRKLELAHQNKELYLLDDYHKVKKNLFMTQKGVLFEGEKQVGTADQAFRVVHIRLWTKNKDDLHGLSKNDFMEMENLLFERYPYAALEWQSPVQELLTKKE